MLKPTLSCGLQLFEKVLNYCQFGHCAPPSEAEFTTVCDEGWKPIDPSIYGPASSLFSPINYDLVVIFDFLLDRDLIHFSGDSHHGNVLMIVESLAMYLPKWPHGDSDKLKLLVEKLKIRKDFISCLQTVWRRRNVQMEIIILEALLSNAPLLPELICACLGKDILNMYYYESRELPLSHDDFGRRVDSVPPHWLQYFQKHEDCFTRLTPLGIAIARAIRGGWSVDRWRSSIDSLLLLGADPTQSIFPDLSMEISALHFAVYAADSAHILQPFFPEFSLAFFTLQDSNTWTPLICVLTSGRGLSTLRNRSLCATNDGESPFLDRKKICGLLRCQKASDANELSDSVFYSLPLLTRSFLLERLAELPDSTNDLVQVAFAEELFDLFNKRHFLVQKLSKALPQLAETPFNQLDLPWIDESRKQEPAFQVPFCPLRRTLNDYLKYLAKTSPTINAFSSWQHPWWSLDCFVQQSLLPTMLSRPAAPQMLVAAGNDVLSTVIWRVPYFDSATIESNLGSLFVHFVLTHCPDLEQLPGYSKIFVTLTPYFSSRLFAEVLNAGHPNQKLGTMYENQSLLYHIVDNNGIPSERRVEHLKLLFDRQWVENTHHVSVATNSKFVLPVIHVAAKKHIQSRLCHLEVLQQLLHHEFSDPNVVFQQNVTPLMMVSMFVPDERDESRDAWLDQRLRNLEMSVPADDTPFYHLSGRSNFRTGRDRTATTAVSDLDQIETDIGEFKGKVKEVMRALLEAGANPDVQWLESQSQEDTLSRWMGREQLSGRDIFEKGEARAPLKRNFKLPEESRELGTEYFSPVNLEEEGLAYLI